MQYFVKALICIVFNQDDHIDNGNETSVVGNSFKLLGHSPRSMVAKASGSADPTLMIVYVHCSWLKPFPNLGDERR